VRVRTRLFRVAHRGVARIHADQGKGLGFPEIFRKVKNLSCKSLLGEIIKKRMGKPYFTLRR